MYILILTGILFLLFIFCIYKAKNTDWFTNDNWAIASACIGIICLFAITMESFFLIGKPLEYKSFKIEYDTVKETTTYKDDIRDANYTSRIIIINQRIRACREFIDSKWIGIFQNKKICELELISKEKENE